MAVNGVLVTRERLIGNPLTPRYQLALAYLKGQELALSSIGHIDALVVNGERISNALASSVNRRGAPKPHFTFEQIITGTLLAGESLLLATPQLTDYFSGERLRQLVTARPPGLALRDIEKYVLGLRVHPPLGVICLALMAANQTMGTGASMEHLLQTKAETASLLQPKLGGYLRNLFAVRRRGPAVSTADAPIASATEGITKPPSSTRFSLMKLQHLGHKLAWLRNRESTKSTMAWWLETKLARWRQLPYSKRVLLVLGLAVLLAFSQSIVSLGRSHLRTVDSGYYNELVTQLTERQAAVEGALIYGDDTKAQTLFQEAQGLLTALPRNSRSRNEQWQVLSQGLERLQRRLQRLNEISSPTV
ncbi:MAG: hypothetical protein U1C53_00430, partial [Candidatus Veblenbacteria bacterium]|nr:hypothetical protein [Candidatus Veblenbacteria bacterium]